MYKYPDYIVKVEKKRKVSGSDANPVYISLLETDRGRILFDLRVWHDGQPTGRGVYLYDTESALKILNALKDYIAEHGEENRHRESITDVLGYNPFEQE